MHTHTCASYSRRCNSHPVWAKPEISSRGETPGSSIAPNYRGPQTESTATVLYNHIVWEEISPLFASASSRALPARGSSKSHLNYHILEMTWALCGRGFYTIWSRRPPHQSFLLYYVRRDQTDTLIPRTHAGLRLVAHTVEGKPIGSICVQFAAYACVCGLHAGHSALCELTRIAIIHHSAAPASGCVKKPAFLSAISHSYLP